MLMRDFPQSSEPMSTFLDFVSWAGSQRAAADLLGLHESTISLIANGKRGITRELAERIEEVSEGKYRKEAVMWPELNEGRPNA